MKSGDAIGRYTIVRRVGDGGMSIVYLAEDRQRRGEVVIKQLREHLAIDRQLVDRFVLGAQIMRDLRHPHLARVIDYIESRGNYFLIEEYLSGGSLADLIDRRATYSEKDALVWCRDALGAVNYAHQHRIVHRDLKPGNLMLDRHNQVKVTDFGIARVFGGPRLTTTGKEMGSPAYMSPEQITSPQNVDHLTDVYSMGVVLYELLTRRVPFDGETDFEIKVKVVKNPPARPRKVNPNIDWAVEQAVLTALAKDPADRFGGCAEFATTLDQCLTRSSRGELDQRHEQHPVDDLRGDGSNIGRRLKAVTDHPEYPALLRVTPNASDLYSRLVSVVVRRVIFTAVAVVASVAIVATVVFQEILSAGDTSLLAWMLLAVVVSSAGMALGGVVRLLRFSTAKLEPLPAAVVDKRYIARRGGKRRDRHTHYYVKFKLDGHEPREFEATRTLYDKVSKDDIGVAYLRYRFLLDYRRLAQ